MDEVAEVEVFGRLLQKQEMPALWDDISGNADSWQALNVDLRIRDTYRILGKRRSLRQFSDTEMTAGALGEILSPGLGFQAFLELPLRPTFPLRFSPSPGGLNVFGAHVIVKNVEGLRPGIYKYNSLRNQVLKICESPGGPLSRMFGNQKWADEAAAVLILSANYKKMAWKYSDQSAFNSLLIESGHIAQNMMVCAAQLSIGSVPTNAIDQVELERHLSLTFPHQAALYALAFGYEDSGRGRDHSSAETLARLEEILASHPISDRP